MLYFVWLTTITFLAPEPELLTYFTAGIVIFYFLFLRSSGDWFWFLLWIAMIVIGTVARFESFDIKINYEKLQELPVWLPLAWGTTIVALRKLYTIVVTTLE